jgi:hypothetical protein
MFLACLFGIIGLLIRIDHLFIIGAVSLFYLEPLLGSLKEVWGKFVRGFVNNWRVFAIFGLALTLALLAVASRNWIMGGKFVLTESQNKRSDIYDENFLKRFEGIAEILTASTLKTGDIAQSSFPAISILWGGTLVSFIALGWRRGPLKSFNLTLGLVCLGALLPYFFFKPTGYFPRWSIHLLPFATLAVIIFIDRFLKWNRAKASRKAS